MTLAERGRPALLAAALVAADLLEVVTLAERGRPALLREGYRAVVDFLL